MSSPPFLTTDKVGRDAAHAEQAKEQIHARA